MEFWIGVLIGVTGTILLEFLYCALTISGDEDK